jgi:hypothetical protein
MVAPSARAPLPSVYAFIRDQPSTVRVFSANRADDGSQIALLGFRINTFDHCLQFNAEAIIVGGL